MVTQTKIETVYIHIPSVFLNKKPIPKPATSWTLQSQVAKYIVELYNDDKILRLKLNSVAELQQKWINQQKRPKNAHTAKK